MPKCTESRRWWECGDGGLAEWTYEGGPKDQLCRIRQRDPVGTDGNPARYPEDAYVGMRDEWAFSPNWVVPQKFLTFVPLEDKSFFYI